MKVLVTGAGGLIGRALVAELSRRGHAVTVTDRPGVDLSFAKGPAAHFELREVDALTALAAGHDAIVHSAGLFDLGAGLETLREANVRAVASAVEAARRAGVPRLVHLSTTGVYGRPRVVPCPETAPLRPRQDYERTKAEGERVARDAPASVGVTVLRPTIVYGPHSRYGFGIFLGGLYLTLARARRSVRLPGGSPSMHAVHVNDVARAVGFCLERPETQGGVYNVADDGPLAMTRVIAILAEELGLGVRPFRYVPWLYRLITWAAEKLVPDSTFRAINARIDGRWRHLARDLDFLPVFVPKVDRDWFGYVRGDHVYDNRALKALGFAYAHPDLRAGLAQTVRWYQEARWLPRPERVLAWGEAHAARRALPEKPAADPGRTAAPP